MVTGYIYIYTYIQYIHRPFAIDALAAISGCPEWGQARVGGKASCLEGAEQGECRSYTYICSLCSLLMFRWGVLESMHVHCQHCLFCVTVTFLSGLGLCRPLLCLSVCLSVCVCVCVHVCGMCVSLRNSMRVKLSVPSWRRRELWQGLKWKRQSTRLQNSKRTAEMRLTGWVCFLCVQYVRMLVLVIGMHSHHCLFHGSQSTLSLCNVLPVSHSGGGHVGQVRVDCSRQAVLWEGQYSLWLWCKRPSRRVHAAVHSRGAKGVRGWVHTAVNAWLWY